MLRVKAIQLKYMYMASHRKANKFISKKRINKIHVKVDGNMEAYTFQYSRKKHFEKDSNLGLISNFYTPPLKCGKVLHGLQSRPPSPKRAERKVRRRPFREAGSGQNNGTR